MPKRIVPLSPLQVQKAKPDSKEYKLFDGGGLYLRLLLTERHTLLNDGR